MYYHLQQPHLDQFQVVIFEIGFNIGSITFYYSQDASKKVTFKCTEFQFRSFPSRSTQVYKVLKTN